MASREHAKICYSYRKYYAELSTFDKWAGIIEFRIQVPTCTSLHGDIKIRGQSLHALSYMWVSKCVPPLMGASNGVGVVDVYDSMALRFWLGISSHFTRVYFTYSHTFEPIGQNWPEGRGVGYQTLQDHNLHSPDGFKNGKLRSIYYDNAHTHSN